MENTLPTVTQCHHNSNSFPFFFLLLSTRGKLPDYCENCPLRLQKTDYKSSLLGVTTCLPDLVLVTGPFGLTEYVYIDYPTVALLF